MYEVYALKYSERDTTKCQFFYREASHDTLTLHYFVWLILGGPHPVLVDTGFLVALGRRADPLHAAASTFFGRRADALLTVSPVVVETCFFLDAHAKAAFLELAQSERL